MSDEELNAYIIALAWEIKKLLEEHALKPPELVMKEMERVLEIREEIESYGILVNIASRMSPSKPNKLEVEVTLLEPKLNLPPEEQKIYDDWFMEAAERWRKRQEKKNKNKEQ